MARKPAALWTLLGLATVAAALTATWRASDMGRAAGELERQRAAARREGVPLAWSDLRRLDPPVADADNAAVPYRHALPILEKAFHGTSLDALAKAVAAGTAKPEDLAKLRTALAEAAPALAEVREGTRRKGFSFDRQWEEGASLMFPEYAWAKHAGQALCLRAMLDDTPAQAADDLETAARLRAHIGSEMIIISPLVGASMERTVHSAIRTLARRGGVWPAAMRPIIADLGPLPDFRRFLAGEAAWQTQAVEEIAKQGVQAFTGTDSETPLPMRLIRYRPVRDAFESRILEHWRGVWKRLPTDPLDVRQARLALVDEPFPNHRPSEALAEILSPVFSGIRTLPAEMETERRLTRTALELWQGHTPVLPPDPFGTGTLRLRREGKAWTLWGRGPDGADDGGGARAGSNDQHVDLVVASKEK